jgi:integrase
MSTSPAGDVAPAFPITQSPVPLLPLPAPSPLAAIAPMALLTMPSTLSMRTAGELWLSNLKMRNRKPAKPATLRTFESHLRNHIAPFFDGVAVESVNNGKMREFVSHLMHKKLSPKSIKEIIAETKALIAAQTNPETGDCLFPRQWRDTVIDAPIIENQNQPIASAREIEDALSVAKEFDQAFIALAAGTGIRVGELLAIRIGVSASSTYWDPSSATVTIKTSMWQNVEQSPKTKNSLRTIELCRLLNVFLKSLVGASAIMVSPGSKFLFGVGFVLGGDTPVSETSLRLHLKKYIPGGFHSLRRFRATTLRAGRCEEQVTQYWLGHSPGQTTTNTYSKLFLDERFRRAECGRIGLGFQLSVCAGSR